MQSQNKNYQSNLNVFQLRTDLDLTEAGLKTCYHNIVNLQQLGIRAVTCNMCGGVAPSTPDQKSICFRRVFIQINFNDLALQM